MIQTMETDTLRTERLLLRPLRPSDAGPLTLNCSDERLARMTALIPHPYPPAAAAAFVESTLAGRRGEQVWAIDATPCDGEELIGVVGYRPDNGEIGYWVGVPYWNAGFATEAVSAVSTHLLEGGAPQLRATVFTENAASAAVLAKVGFVRSGTTQVFSVARNAAVPAHLYMLDRAGLEPGRGAR